MKKTLKELAQEHPTKTGAELIEMFNTLEKEHLDTLQLKENKIKLIGTELSKNVPLYYKYTNDFGTEYESYVYYKVNNVNIHTTPNNIDIEFTNVDTISLTDDKDYFSFDFESGLKIGYSIFEKGLNNKSRDKYEKVSGVDFENLYKKYTILKKDITTPFWRNVDEKRPSCYETGKWEDDGKRSDVILLKDIYGCVHSGYAYEFMPDNRIEFYNIYGNEISENIIQWAEIPD